MTLTIYYSALVLEKYYNDLFIKLPEYYKAVDSEDASFYRNEYDNE